MTRIDLAGPDVFLPDAPADIRRDLTALETWVRVAAERHASAQPRTSS